jgi:GNAT superfamily N-acetyltransferase
MTGASELVVREVPAGAGGGAVCRTILATLPTWFGIDEANEAYADHAEAHPTLVASVDGVDVGLLVLERHTAYAAEVYLMGVRPEHHRQGIGRSLLARAEAQLVAEGVEYLQVKTLDASHPDPGYEETRAFYRRMGFRPLEVFPTLWDPTQPALQLVKRL